MTIKTVSIIAGAALIALSGFAATTQAKERGGHGIERKAPKTVEKRRSGTSLVINVPGIFRLGGPVRPVARRGYWNTRTPGINRRMATLSTWIRGRVQNGKLRPRAAMQLRGRLQGIRHVLRNSRRDGNVTRNERIRIHGMLDNLAEAIERRSRPAFGPRGGRRFRG